MSLTGDGLASFTSVAPDQQVKLFFARDGGIPELPDPPSRLDQVASWYQRYLAMPDVRRPWMRTYSVRRHHRDQRLVDIDFVLHGGADGDGPASRWVAAAKAGDVIGMYGPAHSRFRAPSAQHRKVFAGDETALPAIGAWLESLAPGEHATVFAEVADAAEEQRWHSDGDVEVHWLHRPCGPSAATSSRIAASTSGPSRSPDTGGCT